MPSDVIKLLPDSVANQIAAGEVIQMPASVVKELVENSIDAGATSVQIIIKDAGKTLIQVVDNGCGMSPSDARMSFQKHATSKIRKAEDLFDLHTMGFRGEALPSIAAVAEVEMRTMRAGDPIGTKLIIKGSKVQELTPEVCAVGTSISVKHLFYNFVARRRYLKKDSTELSHIMHEFERLALVNTNVDFTLTHNGNVVHQLRHGPLLARIGQLFGKTVEHQLIPLEAQTSILKVSGFIGLPSGARQRNYLQYFFVNGRNMRHTYFRNAIRNCYKDLIAGEAQPNFFISFEVDPSRIDVNIHPQKHEIKFEDEGLVWEVLSAAVREALGKYNVGPAIDFDATDVPDIPPMIQGAPIPESPVDDPLDPNYKPYTDMGFEIPQSVLSTMNSAPGKDLKNAPMTRMERPSALNNGSWQSLYDNFKSAPRFSQPDQPVNPDTLPDLFDDESEQRPQILEVSEDYGQSMFQLKERWIVTISRSGLMLIDQHRAHTRILYEHILPTIRSGSMTAQRLIFSETMEVDAATQTVLEDSKDTLESLGFDIKHDHDHCWTILAVPAELAEAEPRQALLSITADLALTGADPTEEQRQRIALSMARAAAVRNNKQLTDKEMLRLVSDLFKLPAPGFTPDGLPIVRIIATDQISRLFHRT